MIFLKRKPGEALVIETSDGPIIVQVLPDNELAIEAPSAVKVAATRNDRRANWLPARPRLSVA